MRLAPLSAGWPRRCLGTATKKDTVNEALRYVAERKARSRAILDDPFFLGGSDLGDAEVMSGARR
jgi:hypothetical protein